MSTQYKDHGWKAVQRRIKDLADKELAIGILSDAGNHENGLSLAEVAAINEFGDGDKIPERSAHRNAFESNKAGLIKRAQGSARMIISGKVNDRDQLEKLGHWYAGELKNEIIAFDDPRNADATIKKKGADNPLIDTGRTVNAIQPVVRSKSNE